MHAELSGLSESKDLSRLSVLASKRRTQLSRHEVTSRVMSHENCMSEILLLCTSSMHIVCFPVFESHKRSVASSEHE